MEQCLTCNRNKNTIFLTENRVRSVISEDMKFHIDNKIALSHISPIDIKLIKEARKLYSRGVLQLNEDDTSLVNSDLGNNIEHKGKNLALDVPFSSEGDNPEDIISMDVPLFIRMLEYAREDAKSDVDLHDVTEKAIALSKNGDVLDMSKYDDIIGKVLKESYHMYHRNSSKNVIKYVFNIYENHKGLDKVSKLIKEVLLK